MANFWLAPLKITNPSDFESKNLKKLQLIQVFLVLPAGTNLKNWCYVFSWFNLVHVFKLKKNRRTPLNAKFASHFIRCKIDVWNQIEILCCQSDWLGRAETQYFMETSSFYDIVFLNFFAKIFVNSKFQMVTHVEANDDMFSLFVRFFFIFGSFEQYWLKWNGYSYLQIVKRSLVGSKREAELPVPIFANKFFEKQHSPLWWV